MCEDFGVFNEDSDLVDGPHYLQIEADDALLELQDDIADSLHVGRICRDHDDQEDGYCDICNAEE